MRRSLAGVAALLTLAACGAGGSGTSASCVGPQLVSLRPDRGSVGAAMMLTVEWLHDGCSDTFTLGPEGWRPTERETPRRNVPVYFVQQPHETLVGTMSGTGAHYEGTLRFTVPATARPGPASLLLGPERDPIGTVTVGPSSGS